MRILPSGHHTHLVDVIDPAAVMVVRAWWDAERVARVLSKHGTPIDAPAIHQRRRRGTLLAARVNGRWRYPPFQFQFGEVDDATRSLIDLLWPVAPGPAAEWLATPHPDLGGGSPESVLAERGITQALWHAATDFVAQRRAAAADEARTA